MTEFHVEVVRIGSVEKHPNADTLSLTKIHGGYPVCFRTGEFHEGDLAVYVPVDAVAPDLPEWEFLGAGLRNHRIRAKKLRGIFSMGLLSKAPDGAAEGADVAEAMGFRRYEDVVEEQAPYRGVSRSDGLEVPGPALFPPKYDLEGFRRYSNIIPPDAEVVVTEKIHGQSFRAVHDGERLHVGSRTRWLSTDPSTNTWARVARRYDLATKLAEVPGLIVYGEAYGNNSDMPYGVDRNATGDALAVFDFWHGGRAQWVDHDRVVGLCENLGLPMVPMLARGTMGAIVESLPALAEGPTTIGGASHVREGWVIKPVHERWEPRLGRVALKFHGEGYLTRKGG